MGTSLTLCLLLCKTEQCHPLPGASLGAQKVKNLPGVQETWVRSLGQEDPLEKETATHSSVLAWRTSWGRKELDTTERLSLAHSLIAWGRGSRGHRVCEALGQGWKLDQFPGRPLQQRPPPAYRRLPALGLPWGSPSWATHPDPLPAKSGRVAELNQQ